MITIIGAGIAGLTLGAILEKKNISYIIHEKRASIVTEDYALTITGGDNVIRYLGLELENKMELACFATLNYKLEYLDYNYHSKGNYAIQRKHLMEKLLSLIPSEKIVYNSQIELDSIGTYIICDGIHSNHRTRLLGKDIVAKTGLKIMLLKITCSSNHPLIKSNTVYQIVSPFTEGCRDRIFIKPYAQGVAMCQIVGKQPQIPNFIYPFVESSVYINDLCYIPEFEPPSSVYLLGDALHGMTPYAGQGANLAMTNALILANHLEKGHSPEQYYADVLVHSRKVAKESLDRTNLLHFTENLNFSDARICAYSPETILSQVTPRIMHRPCSYLLNHVNKITKLNLSGLDLVEFPDIFDLWSLVTLEIKDNKIPVIPEKIGNFKQLKAFHFRNNLIVNVPDALWDLTNLSILRLSYNRIAELSTRVNKLVNLSELCLSGNRLHELPVLTLPKLDKLYITRNPLEEADLSSLKSLKVLRIQWTMGVPILPQHSVIVHLTEKQYKFYGVNQNIIPQIYYGTESPCVHIEDTYQYTYPTKNLTERWMFSFNLLSHLPQLKQANPNLFELALKLLFIHKVDSDIFKAYLSNFMPVQFVDLLWEHGTTYAPSAELDEIIRRNSSSVKRLKTFFNPKIYQINQQDHIGLPTPDPLEGRPRLDMHRCLYTQCQAVFNDTFSFIKHLCDNSAYTEGYHEAHEDVKNRVQKGNHKCPAGTYICSFEGNVEDHYALLGIAPYWKRGMKLETINLFINSKESKIYATDHCVICLEKPANMIYSNCLHKASCMECLINMPIGRFHECIVCRHRNLFVLPM